MAIIYSVLLYIDGVIYNLISYVYDIFNFLAGQNLFTQETYRDIVGRIYMILGLVMLFVLAYTLLKAVINPETFAKGEQSFPKLVQNVVISLIIIAVLPTVFSVAFNLQNSILNYDTIPQLILGEDYEADVGTKPGHKLAYNTFNAFFHADETYCESKQIFDITNKDLERQCQDTIKDNGWVGFRGNTKLSEIDKEVEAGGSFTAYAGFSEGVRDNDISYMMIVSTIAGIFILYVLVNFCFDMATRVIKLMFFQIIAPIPVICRVIPGGKMKDVFPDWVKKTVSTFIEVFIRIAILYLGLFLINEIIKNFSFDVGAGNLSGTQLLIAKALLIMGVVVFIKQAPKLIGDMFHLDSGSMKLGIMDKLAMGGGLIAGAAAGGLITAGGRNLIAGVKNTRKNVATARQNGKLGVGAAISGTAWSALSTLAGAGSAGLRSGYGAKGAKNLKDMQGAASKGIAKAAEKKAKRDAYRASHQIGEEGIIGSAGTLLNVGWGHIEDTYDSAKEFWGIGDNAAIAELQKQQAVYKEGMGYKKNLFDLVNDNESVMAYQGLKKEAQEKELSVYQGLFRAAADGSIIDTRNNSVVQGVTSIEAAAIQAKTADIKKYDDAIKLASLSAIHDKIQSGDGRFTSEIERFKVWQAQHANVDGIAGLTELADLTDSQVAAIKTALGTNSADQFKLVLDAFEGKSDAMQTLGIDKLGIMANDKEFKIKNGDVQVKISQKVQEEKAKEGK